MRKYFTLPLLFFCSVLTGCGSASLPDGVTVPAQETAMDPSALLVGTASDNDVSAATSTYTYNGISADLVDTSSHIYDSALVSDDAVIHVLDVGDGTCFIVMHGGRALIIDDGSSQYRDKFFYYLDTLKPTRIDIVLTGLDYYRAGNTVELVNQYHDQIGMIVMPEFGSEKDSLVSSILSSIAEYGLKVTLPADGEKFNIGDYAGILYRPYTSTPKTAADSSCVFSLCVGERQFIIEPYVTGSQEQELLDYHEFDTSNVELVLTAVGSPDGSQCSTTWLQILCPSYVVYNTSQNMSDGVASRLRTNGIGYLVTRDTGTILFKVSAEEVSVTTGVTDYDTGLDYVETTTATPTFTNFNVYVCGNTAHSSMQCSLFSSDDFLRVTLSTAIERGYTLCEYCISASAITGYDEWAREQAGISPTDVKE